MTTWPGQLKFAATTSPLNSAQTFSICSSLKPKTAAIVLGSISHAFCMANARLETKDKPSCQLNPPEATKAENSPKEWPATISGLKLVPNFAIKIECK